MKSLKSILLLVILVTQNFATASPDFRSIEFNLEDSRQVKFEQQIKKQLAFKRLHDAPAAPGDSYGGMNPHQEVMIFLRDHGIASLERYLQANPKTCWDLSDFDQFELSYISLNNISKRYIGDPTGFREYFDQLEDYVRQRTGRSAYDYIRSEKNQVKRIARQLSCNR